MRHSVGLAGSPRSRGCRSRFARSSTPELPPVTAVVSRTEIEEIFRAEYGRAVAVLTRSVGDLDLAEEAVQEAFVVATERWPVTGLPPRPAGWIITTARRRAIDYL